MITFINDQQLLPQIIMLVVDLNIVTCFDQVKLGTDVVVGSEKNKVEAELGQEDRYNTLQVGVRKHNIWPNPIIDEVQN